MDRLLSEDRVGEALGQALDSLEQVLQDLSQRAGIERESLELPFSPFMVREWEISRLLNPEDGLEELRNPRDDLDVLICLEAVNSARRLLASWGYELLGKGSLKLIRRLERELEELKESQAFFMLEGGRGSEVDAREEELADKLTSLAEGFAGDLLELHLLNAAKPEVKKRFELLWETVFRLERDGNAVTAALEALHILEETLSLAGLEGGEILQRVDLLYRRFGRAEDLRRAVNQLGDLDQGVDGALEPAGCSGYIDAIAAAMTDLGLRQR